MHLVYIILAHKKPKQLSFMIKKLYHKNDLFFIHIDKKVNINPFNEIIKKNFNSKNIFFVKNRVNTIWGDMSLVTATINSILEILDMRINYSHISLLSGEDLPIKDVDYIRRFFFNNTNKSFIEFEEFPVKGLNYGGMHRIENYSFNIFGKRETYLPSKYDNNFNFKRKILNFILGGYCLFLPKRKLLVDWKHYYGSQWWSLNKESIELIVREINNTPEYVKYHKYSLIPDEMFFQTILLNNFDKDKIVNNNYRYIKWDETGTHPRILKESDFEWLQKTECLFARKFELDE